MPQITKKFIKDAVKPLFEQQEKKFERYVGVIAENFGKQVKIVVEGNQMLSEKMDREFNKVDKRFDLVDKRFDRVEEKLNATFEQVGINTEKLDDLTDKLDKKIDREEFEEFKQKADYAVV